VNLIVKLRAIARGLKQIIEMIKSYFSKRRRSFLYKYSKLPFHIW